LVHPNLCLSHPPQLLPNFSPTSPRVLPNFCPHPPLVLPSSSPRPPQLLPNSSPTPPQLLPSSSPTFVPHPPQLLPNFCPSSSPTFAPRPPQLLPLVLPNSSPTPPPILPKLLPNSSPRRLHFSPDTTKTPKPQTLSLPSLPQKRRSNRQVKRKKYTEDLDIKITDDEEDEELDVTGPVRSEQPPAPQPPAPEPEPEGETLPSMQFFVENPSEEDAAIVDKVLSMRVVKKELPSGQFTESEEFFVKYKN
ncbi:36.4 kDa proline-rich protein-like, partial [Meleagris gallopavo]|uniref:36.4 kDa proline-rich protein-like n=1 Tax=Meleagris gallopavo TaxID=9103 RepID=UPI000549D884